MTIWQSVPDENSYGVAIYNFNGDGEKMCLKCGDAVHLFEECNEWYRGCLVYDRKVVGVFPKSYIHLIECEIDRSYSDLIESIDDIPTVPIFILKQPPIVQEITMVLREWETHWKKLYVTHNDNFEKIQKQIYELIKHRSKIVSGTLPMDELRKITKQVATEIDMGNKLLELDMVVRDKNGNIINPEKTSTTELYYHHKNSTDRMNSSKDEYSTNITKSSAAQISHIFIVSVKNFTCKMTEDAELLMTLYDAKENKAITENYVVRWSKDGLMSDIDQMYNLRVMFTDLGRKDLEREKIYFVCYVVRIGAMEVKEPDRRSSQQSIPVTRKNPFEMRRPFGVAAKDITKYMSGTLECDLDQEHSIPFYNCERDNLEQTLRKIINKDTKNEYKQPCLFVSYKLLHGDVKQVREENPHLVLGTVAVARKMGFPEVILPGDVRNDLYLTIVSGDFPKGNKSRDKNVEVTVIVCNEKGKPIPGVIFSGGGIPALDQYQSVVYYHEDKPQWLETFKVAIPIDEFKTSHLKFTFKHRSSTESKDRTEKPFGLSYVKLMQNEGTTLRDNKHNLVVYKVDQKKYENIKDSIDYLQLPSTKEELDLSNNKSPSVTGLSFSPKESFIISSNICSTKLTQNVDLLGLLNWVSHKNSLRSCLQSLKEVILKNGEEVVKFFQDILDALFDILMDNTETDEYDELVFQCLLSVIGLVSNDWKYAHFEPVLDLYIKESFSATLAYKKLMGVIQTYIKNTLDKNEEQKALLFKTMRSLQYIVRFIVRSRLLYIKLNPDLSEEDDFESILRDLLDSIISLMNEASNSVLKEQGACLKYLPSTTPDILQVYEPRKLSIFYCNLLNTIPNNKLTKQKMMTINELVHSQLFQYPECRRVLTPYITKQIKKLIELTEEGQAIPGQDRMNKTSLAKVARVLGETETDINQHKGYSEEVNFDRTSQVELCIKILSDMLNLLFHDKSHSTYDDIKEIITVDLHLVVQTLIKMNRQNPHLGNLAAVMLDIFRQMTEKHYDQYIKQLTETIHKREFLSEILIVFKELVNQSVFPVDWSEMIMLQNHIILKALRFCSRTIKEYFFENFDQQSWSNFFHSAIAFMTQPALQLENFSANKRLRVLRRYKDMRREMGFEVKAMWFNLGKYKLKFVPNLVGLILEMTLIPEVELRKATIPIFFDMMQCEFYSSKRLFESFGNTKRDSSDIKGNFNDFENEMILKLDALVEGGSGDDNYKDLFFEIMYDKCSNHTSLKDGVRFVEMIKRLMERLLQYRHVVNDENKENWMSCTVDLLDFYSEIKRKEMYIRYVYKLCDLHKECMNFTEAAFTLQLHTKLLEWSTDPLSPLLRIDRDKYRSAKNHRELKEILYQEMIEYFSKGNMWECALEKCQELVKQYEEETFDYEQLCSLHKQMAEFYSNIMKNYIKRPSPEYFRVGYFGQGFPNFIRNKVFIYRGKDYERISEFSARILNIFPNATSFNKLTPPGDDIKESNGQYIQINKVDPVMDDKNHRFSGKPVAEQIVAYHKFNHIQKFSFSRPVSKKPQNQENNNEFANLWLERTILYTSYSLPGILLWFPVVSSNTYEISPLQNAIETMEKSNKDLRNLILQYNRDPNVSVKGLSLKINGIVDPAVMGGIMNYEEAFFNDDYIQNNPDDHTLIQKLKDLIAEQIPLLELCIEIHGARVEPSLRALHQRIEKCFADMKDDVIEKYGKKTSDLKIEVTIRRHHSVCVESKSDFANDKTSSLSGSKTSILSPSRNSNNLTMSKKRNKTPKEKRKSNKVESINSPSIIIGSSQWYADSEIISTTNGTTTPVIELTQDLTPKRPLRSEVEKEKRLSRPNSGQYSRPSSTSLTIPVNSSGNSSNRDSLGTTDSSISEEDLIPPPLPAKLKEVDYQNLPSENVSFLHSNRNSFRYTNTTPVPDLEPMEMEPPPTPPPKPPKKKKQ
ncbi:dedicator of cytokinesis protein 1 isoform X3 [Onthophagus taurus]|uniref:dedicator of cytokinesis protein 1 isoform X3 n=1 Tax=Onthophagus taurus TaxID=166361 RepID=UPI000C20431B|nr:dedicator of cytokinesis protein 1 isoform X3 [Onthophagus taurus]